MDKLSARKITKLLGYFKQFEQGFLDKILEKVKNQTSKSKIYYDSYALSKYQQAYKYMKKEFRKDTSIIIQGPVYDSKFVTKNYRYYIDLGYQVVVSTWDSNGKWQEALLPDDILVYSEPMEFKNRVVTSYSPLHSLEKGEDVWIPSANYYQALSTLNGFKLIGTEGNVIKMRADEFYSDLNEFEFCLNKNTGTKLISSDTFAIPGKQPSDHLFGTTGKVLYDMCSHIVFKYQTIILLTGKSTFDNYRAGYTPEQEVLESFLYSIGVSRSNTDVEDIFDLYCKIVPKENLGNYLIKANTQHKTITNIK